MAVSAWSVPTRKPTKLRARHPGLLAGDLASARSSPVSAVHEINLSFVCTPMDQDLAAPPTGRPARATARLASQAPDSLCFVTMATFNHLGPSVAVLLVARVHVLGVAWLRIVSAAVILAAWRRPWRTVAALDRRGRELRLAWASALATMNCWFHLAMIRVPLNTVAAIEFLPVIALAALGARSARNALALAVTGRLPADRPTARRRPGGVRIRVRERGADRALHRARRQGCQAAAPAGRGWTRGRDADRCRGRHPNRRVAGRARVHRPVSAACRRRHPPLLLSKSRREQWERVANGLAEDG
jgi:hypothetical protein